MPSAARKNYGNFGTGPVKGDFVCLWGRQSSPHKVTKVTPPSMYVEDIWDHKIWILIDDARPATPAEAATFAPCRASRMKEQKERREKEKARQQKGEEELAALKELCESNPLTALDGEMWKRVRALSPGSLADFVNSGFRVPMRK